MSILYRKHEKYPEFILIRDFQDQVTVDEIIKSWEYLIDNEMIECRLKGVISNITGCELEICMQSFQNLINYLKNKDVFRNIKLAVICESPNLIVFPILGEKIEKELKIKPFSTIISAEKWILND